MRGVRSFTLPIAIVTPFGLDFSRGGGEPRRCWEHLRGRGVRAVNDDRWRDFFDFVCVVHLFPNGCRVFRPTDGFRLDAEALQQDTFLQNLCV